MAQEEPLISFALTPQKAYSERKDMFLLKNCGGQGCSVWLLLIAKILQIPSPSTKLTSELYKNNTGIFH